MNLPGGDSSPQERVDGLSLGARSPGRELSERRFEALTYRGQIDLAEDVPIPHSLADLEWLGAPRERLEEFAQRVGAEDALPGVPRWLGE